MGTEVTIDNLLPSLHSTLPQKGDVYVGIDFGTSTSVVSIARYNETTHHFEVQPIPIEQRNEDGSITTSTLVPSVIALKGSRILVGEGASYLKYSLIRNRQVWYSFKMQLGEGIEYYDSKLRDANAFSICTPEEAATVFFRYLKEQIENYCRDKGLGTNIYYTVSIPASFEANQRSELVEALQKNSMTVARQSLIDEPNAAFLSYIQESVTNPNEHHIVVKNTYNPKVLVFDFGGGTCDISILEIVQGANGFYSKNLSISKFEHLGGDDIDRYIAWHYLIPQLLKANNKTIDDFRGPEKRDMVHQLLKIAEQLKINACKDLAAMMTGMKLPVLKDSEMEVRVDLPVVIDSKYGNLTCNAFSLRYCDLRDTMKVFLRRDGSMVTRNKQEEDYTSIFKPIESALRKAHINKDRELDYVLFIGGSSKNPFIQNALSEYFDESELLIPENLQTHVSKGAAIHSLIMNGFGKNIIQPITSEPIIVVTKNGGLRTLIPAGSQIPCERQTIDDLTPQRNGQKVVELPVCVGNADKMLFNICIKAPDSQGFSLTDNIRLSFEINADKLLMLDASCRGVHQKPELQNPFANKELTTEQRNVIKAEREVEKSKAANGGSPSRQALRNLASAYESANQYFQQAEILEMMEEYYPGSAGFNEIGIAFSNAGNEDKATEAFEKAVKQNPTSSAVWGNLAGQYQFKDKEKFVEFSRKAYELSPNDPVEIIRLARAEETVGNKEHAKDLRQRAYEIYVDKFNNHSMHSWDYGWFASLAGDLGHYDMKRKVLKAEPNRTAHSPYEESNLSKRNSNEIIKP